MSDSSVSSFLASPGPGAPLSSLGLEVMVREHLERQGLSCVADLCRLTRAELEARFASGFFGRPDLEAAAVEEALAKHGFHLGPHGPEPVVPPGIEVRPGAEAALAKPTWPELLAAWTTVPLREPAGLIPPGKREALIAAGIATWGDLYRAGIYGLTSVPGIGPRWAAKLLALVGELPEEAPEPMPTPAPPDTPPAATENVAAVQPVADTPIEALPVSPKAIAEAQTAGLVTAGDVASCGEAIAEVVPASVAAELVAATVGVPEQVEESSQLAGEMRELFGIEIEDPSRVQVAAPTLVDPPEVEVFPRQPEAQPAEPAPPVRSPRARVVLALARFLEEVADVL